MAVEDYFDTGSNWFGQATDSVLDFGGELFDSVSEGVVQVLDARAGLEVQKLQETRKDPDVLKAVEPNKTRRSDGSTVVTPKPEQVQAQQAANQIMGIDKQTLMIGGGVVAALLLSVAVIARGGR